jgi:RNA polymerase sigma-70 factor (ECF subfamily)
VAWLIVTARRRAIDRIRRERTWSAVAERLRADTEVATVDEFEDESAIADERLELIFTCCHPALALDAQVALTLRALGGLSSEEIARAFLVSEETMKRRLSRARAKIKLSGIPFAVPDAPRLPERLDAVLGVVYLIFNQGFADEAAALAAEAVRLGRVLAGLMPDEPEVHGLLALMLLAEARRPARFAGGELVVLRDQDRARWNAELLDEGRALLERAIALRGDGSYVLQAAIAALQCEPEIDWWQVALLYTKLYERTGSPVVELNRAVAVAEAGCVGDALEIVERLAPVLDGYRYLHSTRGELLRRLGRSHEARAAFERALALAEAGGSPAERRFLRSQLS